MSDRTRLIALYCVEPDHAGHDSLLNFPEPVPMRDCDFCRIEAAERPPQPPVHLLRVEVMHINAAYILYVTQVTRERRDTGTSEGHMLFAPCNLRLKLATPGTRFSAKTLAALAIPPAMLAEMVQRSRLLKAQSDAADAEAAARRSA